jgi:hypothetical protein
MMALFFTVSINILFKSDPIYLNNFSSQNDVSTARVFGVEMLSITVMTLSHRHSQRGIVVYLEVEDYLVR